jgi:late competence protein required for DNA uptake (superfamily II DNA/RNA helicase)
MIRFPNGGDLFDFQKNASNWLLDHTLHALDENNTLIVKAPTGSGKTMDNCKCKLNSCFNQEHLSIA